jgi:hypothetical protein
MECSFAARPALGTEEQLPRGRILLRRSPCAMGRSMLVNTGAAALLWVRPAPRF